MANPNIYDPPLAGVRILDLSRGPMTAVGRLLADLGASVTQVHLSGVTEEPDDRLAAGVGVDPDSVSIAINRHGLSSVVIDPSIPDDRRRWIHQLAGADILIEDTRPGSAAEKALAARDIHAEHPGLVILSLSDFGRETSYRGWHATTPVLHALTSELSRSGIPGREPLVPPAAQLPYHVAAAQAAVMTISVYLDRLRTGEGDLIDFSILDGAMQTLDPPHGTVGTASAGVALSAQRRDWNAERLRYPIIACKDGHVRICLLAKRQWHGMFEWMGRPEQFADPSFDRLRVRFGSPELLAAIGRFCAGQTRAELEVAGQRHGVPTAAVLTLAETLGTEQVMSRGYFHEVELAPGMSAPVPAGVVEIDGHRANALTRSDHEADRRPRHIDVAPLLAGRPRRNEGLPLEGLRVLDLGVIVVGSDTGRLFGDLGADVIKIENSAFPDGLRGSLTSVSPTYAAGHRNKRSIGIDLRIPRGRALAHHLVAMSDVVLTNFKPGVAESLGMDYQTLQEHNPGIVVVDSSAFGPTGPWAKRMGYGPLVRAAAGFTDLWVYPDEPESFCDTVTVYPDHVAARIGALGALALLLRRERTGTGGSASVAQSEVMLSHLAGEIAADVLARRGHEPSARAVHDAPWGLFPAAGEDTWLAVTVRDDADWGALCRSIDRPDLGADPQLGTRAGRDAHRGRIDEAVRAWTSQRRATEAMNLLQSAGVPAGAALHADDVARWDYYVQRRTFREELHPHADEPFTMENVQIHSDRIADPPLRQAPLLGEQTRDIAAELLGLDDTDIAELIATGVLEVPQSADRGRSEQPEPAGH
ncbi:CaiB/BaiF CoA-transferase family protein [Mycolicibacterium lutetiense]|uniref:Crotonobetainyl-CoA:carnitine CoA-transferase CaiB-like acyl-CoA transferase n=1 Tax=Mycolicibacterium lutetiense TaxID=1641992 RepID=A0ABS4ZVU5_9MYCO|nr:CoA transferase [Mycolicibacterium lutetiense]MBP2453628.1 crotonobetainyl-CoA:carnitine CoA-transferase CaiB-like acyl-CoA transferase [Mycolicibacterium lutetiense]